jgi:hypothetical protein
MSDPTLTAGTVPRFVSRPSPLGENAPNEIVFTPGNEPSFGDMLQALNPLQHIPGVGQIYRALTGDTIAPAARAIGGMIFGGPLGLASSVINSIVEDTSGKDVGGHMLAMVGLGREDGTAKPQSAPPQIDGTPAFVAAVGSGAAGSGSSLLQSWISGAPDASNYARAEPAMSAPAPAKARADEAPAAPIQTAAAPLPPAASNESTPVNQGKGRSLNEYRQSAVNVVGLAARAPTATGPDQLGFNRRAEANRQLASYRNDVAAAPAVPSTLKAQELVGAANEAADAQSYFTAQMAAGLERYKQMQRRRETAAPPEI